MSELVNVGAMAELLKGCVFERSSLAHQASATSRAAAAVRRQAASVGCLTDAQRQVLTDAAAILQGVSAASKQARTELEVEALEAVRAAYSDVKGAAGFVAMLGYCWPGEVHKADRLDAAQIEQMRDELLREYARQLLMREPPVAIGAQDQRAEFQEARAGLEDKHAALIERVAMKMSA